MHNKFGVLNESISKPYGETKNKEKNKIDHIHEVNLSLRPNSVVTSGCTINFTNTLNFDKKRPLKKLHCLQSTGIFC